MMGSGVLTKAGAVISLLETITPSTRQPGSGEMARVLPDTAQETGGQQSK
jgi:hypothetical protein